jgi:hypothetical protein
LAALVVAGGAQAQVKSFGGFPDVPTTAKAGEHILVPSYNWLEEAAGPKGDQTRFIFYNQTMVTPGAAASKVKYMREERDVPNSYILAIPKGGKAKPGDIVLTWWQGGSGMMRAIVVSAADAARPVVRYLDLSYDNPAKSPDGKTTIGQMDSQLKEDTFVVLKEGAPGSGYRCGKPKDEVRAILIAGAPSGEQLMKVGSALKRFAKGECMPIPLKPAVKAGQMVKVPPYGSNLMQVKVERVDEKIGRVFFLGIDKKEAAAAFGDVVP